MKCVCPMGGDRTCPDDCLLAVWQNMPLGERKTKRKFIAVTLYKQNFTQEQIATQLGVSQMQISRDLEGLNEEFKPPRPKGGRPKGSKLKPGRRKNMSPDAQAAAEQILDDGKTYSKVEQETGLSNIVLRSAVAREEGRREAEPIITPDTLSMTAQQKFEVAVRQEKQKLAAQFQKMVNDRVEQRVNEYWLPEHKKLIADAKVWAQRRYSVMDKVTFNMIRRALHPDSRNSVTDKKLAEAFDAFMALEKRLLDEKDSPTNVPPLPDNLEAWDKMRRQAKSAKRANGLQRR